MSEACSERLPAGTARSAEHRNEEGDIGKVYRVFGDEFNTLLDELNEALAA